MSNIHFSNMLRYYKILATFDLETVILLEDGRLKSHQYLTVECKECSIKLFGCKMRWEC